jgi:uncharacterized protein (TIGR02328 family)
MRLWHKDLISVLPRQQLLGQWRECCCIAKNLEEHGTPNHMLVNKLLDYPEAHFNVYASAIYEEIVKRHYKCDWNKFTKWRINRNRDWDLKDIFPEWHNQRYLVQCYYNLQEKYDCGGITKEEWKLIEGVINKYEYL